MVQQTWEATDEEEEEVVNVIESWAVTHCYIDERQVSCLLSAFSSLANVVLLLLLLF